MPEVLLIRPNFRDGRLHVDASMAFDENWIDRVTSLLLVLWQFSTWNTARWCSVGRSSRAAMIAFCTGVKSLVRMISRSKQNKSHLGAFNNLLVDSRLSFLFVTFQKN